MWEPWHEAALKAAAEGRGAPSLEEVTAASEAFFEGLFSTKVLEYVDEIRRNLSSCGVAEQLAVEEGRASAEQATRPLAVRLAATRAPSPGGGGLPRALTLTLSLTLTLTRRRWPSPCSRARTSRCARPRSSSSSS